MLELSKQQFLDEFMNEFNVAKQEVNDWPSQVRENASKIGVLTFPRNQEGLKQDFEPTKNSK